MIQGRQEAKQNQMIENDIYFPLNSIDRATHAATTRHFSLRSYIFLPHGFLKRHQVRVVTLLPSNTFAAAAVAAGPLPADPVSHNFHRAGCTNVG